MRPILFEIFSCEVREHAMTNLRVTEETYMSACIEALRTIPSVQQESLVLLYGAELMTKTFNLQHNERLRDALNDQGAHLGWRHKRRKLFDLSEHAAGC